MTLSGTDTNAPALCGLVYTCEVRFPKRKKYSLDMDVDYKVTCLIYSFGMLRISRRGGGLGSRPKKMYGEKLGDGVEYHFMKTTPRR